MCSQIYSHPVEGYKCFANANKSQGTYYTCCDLDTREIRYVTYIYDGYFMGYYLVQSATKVTENFANSQEKIFLSSASNKWPYYKGNDDEYTIDRQYPMQYDIPSLDEVEIYILTVYLQQVLPNETSYSTHTRSTFNR